MQGPLTLYIGTVRRGEFESLLQHGVPVGIIIDLNCTIKLPDLSAFRVVEYCNCNNIKTELLPTVDRIRQTWEITCVLETHEAYVLPTTHVTKHLGLPGLSLPAAQLCIDKTGMHERFVQQLGANSTAHFASIGCREDLFTFARSVHWPIILKPTNLYNSLFVSLNFSQEELLANYAQMLTGITVLLQKAGQLITQPRIQAEEFLPGTIHSVDCLVDVDGQVMLTPVVDIIIGREFGWNDFHHFARFTPSKLTYDQQQALRQQVIAGIRALEITSSVAHVEIIQSAQGPKLLEIGARPGGHRSRLLHLNSGFDLVYHYHQVRLGQPWATSQGERQITPTAIISPYARRQGTLTQIKRLTDIQQLPTYLSHEQKTAIGQRVGPSTLGYTAPLTIELQSDRPDAIYQDMETLQSWSDIFLVAED